MRAVLDPNVIISALISRNGAPAKVLRAWLGGVYDVVVSPLWLEELERALSYGKLRERITPSEVRDLLVLLRYEAEMSDDPSEATAVRSPDPGDDYLIALAASNRALLVSGDRHLLELSQSIPVYSPAEFIALLDEGTDD